MKRVFLYLLMAGQVLVGTTLLQAQNRVEGSRPGQTYRVGESAPQDDNAQLQQQGQYQQYQPQQVPQYSTQPSQGTEWQQMDPNMSGQELQRHVEAKDAIGRRGNVPVIMEFSDLQCPDSARYNSGLKDQVMQRYVSSGRASYEWHDFPLPSHPQAREAAAAARCAGQAADRVRQQIMANQGQMSENVYAGYARQAGTDQAEMASCMRSGRSMRDVMADKALGESLGVRGTPTLVVAMRDGSGRLQPLKVVKGYNTPQQVFAEIDSAIASAAQPAVQGQQLAPGYPAGAAPVLQQPAQPMPQTY